MTRPENWITQVEINDDTMTINGVPASMEEEREMRKKWKEEQEINASIYERATDTELLKFLKGKL